MMCDDWCNCCGQNCGQNKPKYKTGDVVIVKTDAITDTGAVHGLRGQTVVINKLYTPPPMEGVKGPWYTVKRLDGQSSGYYVREDCLIPTKMPKDVPSKDDVTELKKQLVDVQRALHDAVAKNINRMSEITDLKAQLESSRIVNEHARKQHDNLRAEFAYLKKDNNELLLCKHQLLNDLAKIRGIVDRTFYE